MANIDELRAGIAAKRAEYQAKHDTAPAPALRAITEEVKRLSNELNAQLITGAEPCEDCEQPPMGLVQQIDVKGEAIDYFEIGCSKCPDHRAQGFSQAQAVKKWNDERYLPKKDREDSPAPAAPKAG